MLTELLSRTVFNNGSAMYSYTLGADETPDIPNVFILSVSSAEKFGLIIPRWTYLKFFPASLCRPNDKGFVIEEHFVEIMKEVGQK